jgi:hypothetical protein
VIRHRTAQYGIVVGRRGPNALIVSLSRNVSLWHHTRGSCQGIGQVPDIGGPTLECARRETTLALSYGCSTVALCTARLNAVEGQL